MSTNASTLPNSRQLLVADTRDTAIAELLQGARAKTLTLDNATHPLVQITQALGNSPLEVLHLVGHGRPGALQLGDHWINAATLISHCDSIWQWQVRNIAIWGCDIGRDSSLVHTLAQMTGAFVYTSDKPLGMTPEGPNWQLSGGFPAELVPFETQVLQT